MFSKVIHFLLFPNPKKIAVQYLKYAIKELQKGQPSYLGWIQRGQIELELRNKICKIQSL